MAVQGFIDLVLRRLSAAENHGKTESGGIGGCFDGKQIPAYSGEFFAFSVVYRVFLGNSEIDFVELDYA